MQIKTNGKILETRPLANLLIEGEAHADKVTILLPLKYDTLDLVPLTYILAGASEKDTRVEQTLTKATTSDAVSLVWDIDSNWTAVSGRLSLELLGQDSAGTTKIKFASETPLLVKQALPVGIMARPDIAQQYLEDVRTLAAQTSNNAATAADNAATTTADAAQTQADRLAAEASATAAQSSAAAAKADADRAHAVAGFDGTFDSLTGKPDTYQPKAHGHAISDVTDLAAQLSNKANPSLLINGDFQVWQRGTSFNTSGDTIIYTADRWRVYTPSGRTSTVTKDPKGLKVVCSGVIQLLYCMEQSDFDKIKDKNITMQYSVNNIVSSVSYVANIALPFGDNRVVQLTIEAGTHIVNWVKLELGSVGTLYIPRSYGEELALCQRYYQRSFAYIVQSTCFNDSDLRIRIPLHRQMRISQNVSQISGSSLTNCLLRDYVGLVTPTALTTAAGQDVSALVLGFSGSFVTGQPYTLGSDIIQADAEIY